MDSEVMKHEHQYYVISQMNLYNDKQLIKGLTLSSDFQYKILKEFYQ